MGKRKKTPSETEELILTGSARRCTICYGLHDDLRVKKGQIAHLDQDPSNSNEDNLVFLCLEHHDEFDSRTSQSKGLTPDEVRTYRKRLYDRIAQRLSQSEQHSRNQEQRAALIKVLGDMVPDAQAFLNMPLEKCMERIKEIKMLHKRIERVKPLFHNEPEIKSALTRIGNIVGSASSQYFQRTIKIFEIFERDVGILEDALKRLDSSRSA